MEVEQTKSILSSQTSDKVLNNEVPSDSMLMALYVMLLLMKTTQDSLVLHQKELRCNQERKMDFMHAFSQKPVWTIEPLEKVDDDKMQEISTFNALKSAESQILQNKMSVLNQSFSISSSKANADGQGATQIMSEFSNFTACLKNLTDKIMR